MPQLNPSPWLPVLIFSWLTFLIILPPKIMKHNLLSEPTQPTTKEYLTTPWIWPWH
uniref:ATP synthase complex subunit 8 n=1 Tax=Gymnarchus niloticus TaxID=42648 RepID=C4IXD5_GYMNI|nr:ATPase subunits 8 [Gymnarchus niloticus]BAJ54289.1 ATPase subunits 8 [Gymnarchus niloticus]